MSGSRRRFSANRRADTTAVAVRKQTWKGMTRGSFNSKKKKLVCLVVSKLCTAPTDGTKGFTDGG